MSKADALIEQLALIAHPEGGWYRETFRADSEDAESDGGGRARWTAINFLLKADESSHWHKVDADELWIWQGGDPLELRISVDDQGPVETITLGGDASQGQKLQGLVPPHAWQAARALGGVAGYSLVSCVVTPGFQFEGFVLAPPAWEPGAPV